MAIANFAPRAVVVGVLAVGALAFGAQDASAQWRRGRGPGWGPGAAAAGVIGGLAAGAIIAGAANPYPYYGPAPVYAAPPARCWFEPEDVWNGYRWVRRRVRVCE